MKKVTYHVKRTRSGAKVRTVKHKSKERRKTVTKKSAKKASKKKKMEFAFGTTIGGFWD